MPTTIHHPVSQICDGWSTNWAAMIDQCKGGKPILQTIYVQEILSRSNLGQTSWYKHADILGRRKFKKNKSGSAAQHPDIMTRNSDEDGEFL